MKRMNIRNCFALSIITLMLFTLTPRLGFAQADTGNGGNFGIGVMLGEPTGISIKSWTGPDAAFALGAAWSLTGDEAIHLHGDYLRHVWFQDVETGQLAFYFGLGARIIFSDDAEAGIRIPLGLNYLFSEAPFDVFVEAVPILNLTPSTDFAGNGAVGFRYYF